ncbi:MAG: hypothetical protein ACFFGZ_20255 [Candidatus Thorarchaeota archaeon]
MFDTGTKRPDDLFGEFKKRQQPFSFFGIIFLLLWLLAIALQAEPALFLGIGLLYMCWTLFSRVTVKRRGDIEVGGGVFGFIVAWLVAQFFYEDLSASVMLFEQEFQVEDVMLGFLLIILVGWLFITGESTSQDLVFNLSPLMSSILLNFWKIGVLIELLTLFNEFEFLRPYADLFFLFCGLLDLGLHLTRRFNLNYTDLILNPFQLLVVMFVGAFQAVKWILLVAIFVGLDRLELGLGTWTLIISAMGVAIICFSESMVRTTLNSGIIESRVEEGKAIVPLVFEEIHQFDAKDFQVYEVQKTIEVRKRASHTKFSPKSLLLRLPFSPELENLGGIFLIPIELTKIPISSDGTPAVFASAHTHRGKFGLNLRAHDFFRISQEEWDRIHPAMIQRETAAIATELELENPEAIDNLFQETVQTTILAQEHLQNRLRGVPAPTRAKPYTATIQDDTLRLPKELLEAKGIREGTQIDIIPGKGEFLFYGRARKKN